MAVFTPFNIHFFKPYVPLLYADTIILSSGRAEQSVRAAFAGACCALLPDSAKTRRRGGL
jgi:hypothetical protein